MDLSTAPSDSAETGDTRTPECICASGAATEHAHHLSKSELDVLVYLCKGELTERPSFVADNLCRCIHFDCAGVVGKSRLGWVCGSDLCQ